jgi:hypothetical protein
MIVQYNTITCTVVLCNSLRLDNCAMSHRHSKQLCDATPSHSTAERTFYVQTFFQKILSLWFNVEKCGTAEQATGDIITRHMRFVCSIAMATDTHTQIM